MPRVRQQSNILDFKRALMQGDALGRVPNENLRRLWSRQPRLSRREQYRLLARRDQIRAELSIKYNVGDIYIPDSTFFTGHREDGVVTVRAARMWTPMQERAPLRGRDGFDLTYDTANPQWPRRVTVDTAGEMLFALDPSLMTLHDLGRVI